MAEIVTIPAGGGVPVPPGSMGRGMEVEERLVLERRRVHHPAQPRTVIASPSLHGDVRGRPWANWVEEGWAGPHGSLYHAVPLLAQDAEGALVIEQLYGWPIGQSIAEQYARVRTRHAWPGPRGDNLQSGAMTWIGLPLLSTVPERARTEPAASTDLGGTTWAGIDQGGMLVHGFPDGEQRGICGPWIDPDVLPTVRGVGRVWHGDFDLEWGKTNDLTLDPTFVGRFYVVDGLNGRVASAQHMAPGPHVQVRTWAEGFVDPVAIENDGTEVIFVADLGANQIEMISLTDGSRATLVGPEGLHGPASIRRTSRGTLVVAEQFGPASIGQRVLEVAIDGSFRHVNTIPNGDPAYFRQLDCDRLGTVGPVDDIIVAQWSSGMTIYRMSLDGSYRSRLDNAGKGGGCRSGRVPWVSDCWGHYPAWVAISRTHGEMLASGGAPPYTFLFRPATGADANGYTSAQGELLRRGRAVSQYGTTAMRRSDGVWVGQPNFRASLWSFVGHAGINFSGLPTSEDICAMTHTALLDWMRAGAGSLTPRPEFTDDDARAWRQYCWMACRGSLWTTVPAEGTEPGPEPPDPPDPPDPVETPMVSVVLEPEVTYRITGGRPV